MSWRLPHTRFCSLALSLALLVCALPLASTTLAAELIVDNSDAAVQIKGKWAATNTTTGFLGNDYLFRTPGDGSATVGWPFPNGAAGRYQVFVRWTAGPNRATNANYQINSNAGAANVVFNQKNNGGGWQSLGTFDFQPGKAQGVVISDKADGVVVADAVRFLGPTSDPAPATQPQPAPAPAQQAALGPSPAPVPNDDRFFQQTGYRIGEDAFWDYFRVRGGIRSFGYPVSNVFTLFGMKVQIFQRQILQLRPDGGVQTMNILDEGLLPYTRMNGSTFPAPDAAVINQSPKPDAPNYHAQTLEFVRATAPDMFEGEPVNFAKTFFGTVRLEEAYPKGVPDGGEGLLPYFNLEIWGLPTSRPTRDPANPSFIYQRFQRGIMHYDKSCGCTQGLLLADYVKALLTGRNLPPDLAEQARGSKLVGQFKPGAAGSLARPGDLPGSDLSNSFRRDPTVTLDAGHGGTEIGAAHTFPDGTTLIEKELNLRVMLRLRDLLQQAGYQVTPTRTRDAQVNADKKDQTGDGRVTLSDDLQARVDLANATGSDLFVSVHFNGISDPNVKGTYVFYDPDRPFADRSKTLAEMVDQALVRSLKDAGYTTVDHGATKDTAVLGGDHYYLLSPKTSAVTRPSEMPAIIGESLFITNEDDANALRKDQVVEAVARGYADGIKAYFSKFPIS
ncbi:MAG TPA: N-acetylmuramoyl-L-alanine amidase [Chloroflexota bacterium]|nr:N-acetylmuramoyl-L-alanine amidase [Chloroflexota bacterium]